ncbi:uncharacterized protein LOC105216094 [Zeugodacus cucurbitae]|uniref:Neuropilin and tolloid-like protein 2 n=1 Tax=Zeugodacus cucurbitae TaxID=28588 RepID=A0A0A1WKL1_ZEUCU|nr:uncharacterized protein LOC105216094 [Zeugodacus cucurbitae]XP_011188690.1 uncharacterized protein LOC105216094 [Zeugodacus cucurbitae]XP_054086212.1 uncharacterized protein LOC105216094 [Zeugodacus cucurbitae]
MLRPQSCGPGPPLPPPPPPPPPTSLTLTTACSRVNNKRPRLVGKCVETVAQKEQKSIVGESEWMTKAKSKIATTTTTCLETTNERLAANAVSEWTQGLQSTKADDDFCITTTAATTPVDECETPTTTNANSTVIIAHAKPNNNKNNNNWSIFKLPMLLLATALATITTTLTMAVAKTVCEIKTATKQRKMVTGKKTATVGGIVEKITKAATTATTATLTTPTTTNANHANSMCSKTMATTTTTLATTAPSIKWLLMWLMLFGIMAQAPQHQVAAEKSKHYYMQALCKNHFLQQLYRKIDGAVLWSQNERNLDCIITFQTHSILQRFMLRFDMLQLDCNDHLYVYDGAHAVATPKADISCRNTKQTVSSILTRTNFVTLKYVTDNWGTDANGFKLVITSVKDPKHTCNDFTCAAREFCISPDLLCDGINHCGDNSDESVCQSETAATVFGVDMTWFVLIVVGIVLVLSAVIVGISICVCRRQEEANLNQNTAIQMHHTAETNGSSKHLHYHHGGTLSREHTQLPPTSGNWHHPAGPYGYHRILRNLSKMATKVRPIWCLANSVN